jgi:hypothetical protein
MIDAVNHVIDLIIPVYGQEGGTMVIPGHGRLSDLGDVLNYREMATIVRDRVQDLKKKGLTLDQVRRQSRRATTTRSTTRPAPSGPPTSSWKPSTGPCRDQAQRTP